MFCNYGRSRLEIGGAAGLGFNIWLESGDGLASITGQQIQNGRFLIDAWRELLLAGPFLYRRRLGSGLSLGEKLLCGNAQMHSAVFYSTGVTPVVSYVAPAGISVVETVFPS